MLPSPGPLGVAPRVIGATRRDLQEGLHRAQDDRGRAEWPPPRAMPSVRLYASLGLPASRWNEEGAAGLGGYLPIRPEDLPLLAVARWSCAAGPGPEHISNCQSTID
jgi:hypothetical protein